MSKMKHLLDDIRNCTICHKHLHHGVNPVLVANRDSKIIIIGQAPGRIVHETSVPWDDKSGDRLREWMYVSKEQFYDVRNFAILPMGFCYPGKGKSGDLPPRPECAPLWHEQVLSQIKNPQLTLLIGSYSQAYYLGDRCKRTLTETVKAYKDYLPKYLPLPHPSPRNNIWMAKNSWFEEDVIPTLKEIVAQIQAH